MVFPGVMSPRSSACVIMESTMRSLTLLAGLEDSSLATISAPQPSTTLFNLTSGVLPMRSRTLSAILADSAVVVVVVSTRDVVDDGANAATLLHASAAARVSNDFEVYF